MIHIDRVFDEPVLEFGHGEMSPDIREGVLCSGPVDLGTARATTAVKLGFVGTPKTIAAFTDWMQTCSVGIAGDDPLNRNFNPDFPGLDPSTGFGCSFLTDRSWVNEIADSELNPIIEKPGAILTLAELFHKRIRSLYELTSAKPDVVICLPPLVVQKRVKPRFFSDEDDEDESERDGPDFHDYLKGLALKTKSMVQMVWPRTYGSSPKGVQDPATRAWNLFGALFYKAGGAPWKLHKPPGSVNTCYVGISFSRREEGGYMHSSLTQIFNDKGEGTILRGGMAYKSEEDREVHLPKDAARKLLDDAIQNYMSANDGRLPDRIVIHKSSGYDKAELEGVNEAADKRGVRFRDLLALGKSNVRLFRHGAYPPLRGTHVILDESTSVLYTRGSVAYYRKYPGPYVPRAVQIRYFQTDRNQSELAGEVLALTKLNWNKTQFDSLYPITLAGSRRIGEIYQWCPDPPNEPMTYAFFM
jgi:hypothetical protein